MNAYTKEAAPSRGIGFLAAATGLLVAALLLVLVTAAPVHAKSAETIKRAALAGTTAFSAVNGEAKWKSKGGERELEIQIEDAKKLAGKTLTVRIGGKAVGAMKVSALGGPGWSGTPKPGRTCRPRWPGREVRITTATGKLVAWGRSTPEDAPARQQRGRRGQPAPSSRTRRRRPARSSSAERRLGATSAGRQRVAWPSTGDYRRRCDQDPGGHPCACSW